MSIDDKPDRNANNGVDVISIQSGRSSRFGLFVDELEMRKGFYLLKPFKDLKKTFFLITFYIHTSRISCFDHELTKGS